MIDFTKVPNIHYWTQRVLPCVFDESLSYVEKINKLEEEINKLIEDYNTFGQAVTNEINTFEGETTNQINAFVTQVTDDINSFKENVTNNINSFETDIRNIVEEFETAINNDIATFKQTITTQQEQFETRVNNDINAMQEVVNEIPNTVTTQVNAITQPWLVANVPAMVESSVANNVNKFFDVDQLYNSGTSETIGDINNWTETGIYFGTTNSEFLNFPGSVGAGYNFWCIVGHSADTSVYNPLQQNLYISNGNVYYRSQSDIKQWGNWYKSNISVTNIPYNTTIDFNTYFYASTEVANGDMWIGTFQSYDKWLNAPSDLIDGDIVNVNIYYYIASGNLYIVQVVTKIDSPSNNNNIGKIWARKKFGEVWSSWTGINNENLIIKNMSNGFIANAFKSNMIVTCDSATGGVNTGLPNFNLANGHYYIQTIKNSDKEILQYLYNTGDYGANIYSRQKNGNAWSVWRAIAPNVRYEETTNFTLTGANPSYENYYPTTISTIGLPDENIFDGFEVQAIVNIDGKSSNPTPMLYNANLVYNANSPNVITIGFKVFDYESQAGKFYVKFRVLDWR